MGVTSEYQLTFEESTSKDDLNLSIMIKDETVSKIETSVDLLMGKNRTTIKPRESVLH